MPTARPRHSVTESAEITAALRDAARRWPEDRESPGRLLTRLLRAGHDAIRDDRRHETADRLRGIEESAGVLDGAYPAGYLDDLRDDWPA